MILPNQPKSCVITCTSNSLSFEDCIRDFDNTLILARIEAEEDPEEDLEMLTDTHIIMILTDVFFGDLLFVDVVV